MDFFNGVHFFICRKGSLYVLPFYVFIILKILKCFLKITQVKKNSLLLEQFIQAFIIIKAPKKIIPNYLILSFQLMVIQTGISNYLLSGLVGLTSILLGKVLGFIFSKSTAIAAISSGCIFH